MSALYDYDIVIIGAGVVGVSCAYCAPEFFPNHSIAVLEKNFSAGEETSSHNSGVLHSNIQQNPNSLKGRLSEIGRVLAVKFAEKTRIPIFKCGMLIAVPSSEIFRPSLAFENAVSLRHLFQKGRKNGLEYQFLTAKKIRELEEHIRASFGIFIPSVSVIDSGKFTQALTREAVAKGADFFYGNEVADIRFEKNYTRIITNQMEIRAKIAINAAGLYADKIANLAIHEERYRQYFLSGEYYEVINPEKRALVSRLIYPAVSSANAGKGIHLGPWPGQNGKMERLFIGPNSKPISGRDFRIDDRSSPNEFLKVGNMFGLGLTPDDVRWSHVGIRPKKFSSPKDADFSVSIDSVHPLFANLMWIDSPGISSAIGIGRYTLVLLRDEIKK